jgi:hypothetical protein
MRDAPWLSAARARAYLRVLLILVIAGSVLWIALSDGQVDRNGKPLGSDFISFWTASKLALQGHAADVYRPEIHQAAQTALMPEMRAGYFAFFYPPTFLLICLPLAALPYLASLALWLGATLAAYWQVARRFLGDVAGPLPIFAFPAVLINIAHGQNGFLSMACLGGGILALEKRPVLAGALFGALAYKPHLALLVPIALIAARRWKAFAAAAATALGLVALSYLVLGAAAWQGFFAVSSLARATLEQGLVGAAKMQSSFAAVRLLGGGVPLAYGVQIAVAILAAVTLIVFEWKRPRAEASGPALAIACLLASPFLLDYDLTILAIPLAWLAREGVRTGFLPWEKLILLIGFCLPLISRLFALGLGVPIAPIVIAAVLATVIRRGLIAR